jgi:hypothetical protein
MEGQPPPIPAPRVLRTRRQRKPLPRPNPSRFPPNLFPRLSADSFPHPSQSRHRIWVRLPSPQPPLPQLVSLTLLLLPRRPSTPQIRPIQMPSKHRSRSSSNCSACASSNHNHSRSRQISNLQWIKQRVDASLSSSLRWSGQSSHWRNGLPHSGRGYGRAQISHNRLHTPPEPLPPSTPKPHRPIQSKYSQTPLGAND